MRITALGKPFYNYPKSTASANKALISALRPASADIFCFKGGNSLSDKIGIIPSSTPTPLEKQIENVVFDRGGYLYHGRVKALAEAAREAGLKF